MVLLRNLPLDSATSASLRGGDQFREWDGQMYMLANLIDAIKENTHAFVSAHSGRRRPAPPKPFPRPQTKKTNNPMQNKFAAMARIAYSKATGKKD